MTDRIELHAQVLDYPITVTATPAGQDWVVSVLGGCAPHAGSVSLAEYTDGTVVLRSLLREAHKDQIVGDRFARELAQQLQCTVSVTCGIHFDNATPEQLKEIVACTDGLLSRLLAKI